MTESIAAASARTDQSFGGVVKEPEDPNLLADIKAKGEMVLNVLAPNPEGSQPMPAFMKQKMYQDKLKLANEEMIKLMER